MQGRFQQSTFPYSYYAFYVFPSALIPQELLNEEKALEYLAHHSGICFARIERRTCEDLFRIRIAADPSCLDDDERSHLLFVSPTELHSITEIFQISADLISGELLGDDSTLRLVACRDGACFARIERQISWDLYAIRIGPDPRSLSDEGRSHRIYATLAELQSHARAARTQQKNIDPSPTNASGPARHKDVEFKTLQAITISEEEIRKAEETMDYLREYLPTHGCRPGSKFLRRLRQWIDLVLFRAVLAALEYQKDFQDAVRQALVSRRWVGKRLIRIRDMYEIDHHTYWSIQVYVPVSCI